MPVPAARSSSSRSPRGPSSGSRRTRTTRTRASGKPAHLDSIIFKWYGDADAMIAGYRGGEVDFATDLQDSDFAKVADLGDQVSAIPALLYEFLRPNWSRNPRTPRPATGGCSHNPAVARVVATGCPMADPAMRQAVAYAIDKNEINTRLLGGYAQVANTNISPGRLVLRGPDPGRPTIPPRPTRSSTPPAGQVARTASARRTASRRSRALHDDPPGPPGHPRAHRRVAEGGRDRGHRQRGVADDIFATTTRAPATRPCILARSNFDIAEHAFSLVDRPAGQLLQLPQQPVPTRRAPTTPRSTTRTSTAALDTVKTSVDFDGRQGRHGGLPEGLRRPDGRDPALLPQERRARPGRASGTSSPTRTQAGSTWNAVRTGSAQN